MSEPRPSSDAGPVRAVRRGRCLLITINRPERRNAINAAVAHGLATTFAELDESPDLFVGVLTGAGGTFCAGMDLKAFSNGERAYVAGRGFAGIVEMPPAKPIVAAVDGWALGGGFEIVLACDLVVAGESARFGLPEVKRGLVARAGGAMRLPQRLPRPIALELILTGEAMTVQRAAHFGLVNKVVPDGQAVPAALELAELVARNAPLAVRAAKQVAVESASWAPHEAFAKQHALLEPVFASADAKEGTLAFQQRRDPVWRGR